MDRFMTFLHWLALLIAIWNTCAFIRRNVAYEIAVRDKLRVALARVCGYEYKRNAKAPFIIAIVSWLFYALV